MAEFQSPTLPNPALLSPVNPAIERYMRDLLSRTDHPVLSAMETLARERNFPIVDRLGAFFWKPKQGQSIPAGCLNLAVVMDTLLTGLPGR